jgi:hypothetical protein
MASAYPGALDALATNKGDATTSAGDHAAHHNDLADAVNKVEAELGVDPSGSAATVAARFSSIDNIRGKTIPTPGSSDNGKGWVYDHASSAMVWTDMATQVELDSEALNRRLFASGLGYGNILKLQSFDPTLAGSAKLINNAGFVHLERLLVPQTVTISNLYVGMNSAGAGYTANRTFAGIYSASGALLRGTNDLAAILAGAAGVKTLPLTAALTINGGEGIYVYFAIVTTATTAPGIVASAPTSGGVPVNAGLVGPAGVAFNTGTVNMRSGYEGGGARTALPAQLGTSSDFGWSERRWWAAAD